MKSRTRSFQNLATCCHRNLWGFNYKHEASKDPRSHRKRTKEQKGCISESVMEELSNKKRDLGKRVGDNKKYTSLFSNTSMNLNFRNEIYLEG